MGRHVYGEKEVCEYMENTMTDKIKMLCVCRKWLGNSDVGKADIRLDGLSSVQRQRQEISHCHIN